MITTTLKKTVNFNETVLVDGAIACVFTGSINTENPEDYTIGESIVSKALYKANRDEIAELRSKFEDMVWEEQQSMKGE